MIMRSQTSSLRADATTSLHFITIGCAAGVREKIPRTFADRVGLFNKTVLSSLVCARWCICVCIDVVGPSNATERAWVSAASAALEAPI